jgi:uncharacterized protein YndB with AHSA1/START domain
VQPKPSVHVEDAQFIRAPREQVFQAWTEYDAWPKVSPLFRRVTVAERVGNTTRVEMETRFMGLRMPRTEKHVLTPPEKIEVIGDVPMATNTSAQGSRRCLSCTRLKGTY